MRKRLSWRAWDIDYFQKCLKKCKCSPFFPLQPSNSKRFLPGFGHSLSLEPLSFPKWQSVWVLAEKNFSQLEFTTLHSGICHAKILVLKNLSVLCVNKTGDHPSWLTFSSTDTTSGYNVSCLWNTVDFLSPPLLFLFSLLDVVHACKPIWICFEVRLGLEVDDTHSALLKDFIISAGFCQRCYTRQRLCHNTAPQRQQK